MRSAHFLPLVCALAIFVLSAGLLGCTPEPTGPEVDEDLGTAFAGRPATVLVLDEAAPRLDLVGQGSLFRGRGWDRVEFDRQMGLSFSWALGERARLYYPGRGRARVDLILRGYPVRPEEGDPTQVLTLRLDGIEVARREMPFRWQTLRIELPDHADAPGLHELELAFDRHAPGCNPQASDRDCRPVAAAFARATIVDRSLEDAEEGLEFAYGPRFAADGSRIWLPFGGTVGVSVPPRSRVEFRFRPPSLADCETCELGAELVHRDGAREPIPLADTPEGETAIVAVNERDELATLALGLDGSAPGRAGASLDLPAAFLFRRPLSVPPTEPVARAPDAIVYLIDTLRSDLLSPYGGPAENSPRIAAFASDAVVYDSVSSPSSWTLPAVGSLLSGLYPTQHRADRGPGWNFFHGEEGQSLSEALVDSGYRTLAISQSEVAGPTFGFDRGFDRFIENKYLADDDLGSPQARRIFLTWLATEARFDEPLFLYFHTVEPHEPYAPTPPARRFADDYPPTLPDGAYSGHHFAKHDLADDEIALARLRALYRGEVLDADREFGEMLELLRYLGRYDGSLIALTSDHGEEFAEHGGFDHGRSLFEELVAVPLIVRFPDGAHAGTRVPTRVSTLDLPPTLLRFARPGEPSSPEWAGRPLPPIEPPTAERIVFTEVSPLPGPIAEAGEHQGAVAGGRKGIHSRNGMDQWLHPIPPWQAFLLTEDPDERAPQPPPDELLSRCQALVSPLVEERDERLAEEVEAGSEMDEATLQRLRALGYVR